MKIMNAKTILGSVALTSLGVATVAGVMWGAVQYGRAVESQFVDALNDVRHGAIIEKSVVMPVITKSSSSEQRGPDVSLETLVRGLGIDPTSRYGRAIIYDASCNPENKKNLYGVDEASCAKPSTEFISAGVKGGQIQLHVPSGILPQNY